MLILNNDSCSLAGICGGGDVSKLMRSDVKASGLDV